MVSGEFHEFHLLRQRLIANIARLEKTLDSLRAQLRAIDAILSSPDQTVIPGVVPPGTPLPSLDKKGAR